MPTEAEWLTRKSRIDTKLVRDRWRLVQFSPALNLQALDKVAVEELPTANGPADYALFVKGELLGIVEAKKVSVNPQNVLEQAKRYAAACSPRPVNGTGFGFLSSTYGVKRPSNEHASQKKNERISIGPFLLWHFSPGDKIENCSAQFLAVCWIVRVEFKVHCFRDGFSVSNALLLGQSLPAFIGHNLDKIGDGTVL
jgi:hypothetical protein